MSGSFILMLTRAVVDWARMMDRTSLEDSSPTEKTMTLGLSRPYSSRKSSEHPLVSDGSTLSSVRSSARSSSEGDGKKREMERGKSVKTKGQEKMMSKVRLTELKEAEPSREHVR